MDSSFSNGRAPGAKPVAVPQAPGDAAPTGETTPATPSSDAVTVLGVAAVAGAAAVAAVAAVAMSPIAAALSPATGKFHSCRWRKAPSAENTLPDHCTHRDVLPMAGTAGFSPDSWCSDCGFYKAKRTPRKREPEPQEGSDTWRRW